MAWIEVHQSLIRHKKTNRAVALLRCNRYKFIGHMVALWCWALDNVPDGRIGDLLPGEIADAAGWEPAKADDFVNTLVAVGFIDEDGDEGWTLHDWDQYAGRLNDLRQQRSAAGRKSGEVRRTKREQRSEQNAVLFEQNGNARLTPTNQPTNQPNQPHQPSAEEVLAARPNIYRLYEQLFGKGVSPLIAQRLREYEDEMDAECVEHCFVEAAESNARSLKLVYSILDRHQSEGCYAGKPGARDGATTTGALSGEPPSHPYGLRHEFVLDPGGDSGGEVSGDTASDESGLEVRQQRPAESWQRDKEANGANGSGRARGAVVEPAH